ncbi:MAG: hypothetical protein AB3N63_09565 [Puniceicoccaceae bacterium]
MRSREQYRDKWSYILLNPVRAGLVDDTTKWKYKGIIECLEWHD